MKKLILILALVTISHSIIFSQGCLTEGFTINTQEQIDSFQMNYPGCTEIEGDVIITGPDITNLNGLNVLTSIGQSLGILETENLANLEGLNNLTTIGIDLEIMFNNALNSLIVLENLTLIGGEIWIWENYVLGNLFGLENIDPNSVSNLSISWNPNLSDCDVQSICEYLVSPNGSINIHDNAPGCNSLAEVEENYQNLIDKNVGREKINIFPNPTTSFITITTQQGQPIEQAIIYNHLGQKVVSIKPENNTVDISGLRLGIYLIEISTDSWKVKTKFVKK